MVMPAALEAERALLGALMLEDSLFAQAGNLSTGDFFLESNRAIWRAMLELRREKSPFNPVLLCDRLRAEGAYEQVGGHAYVASLWDGIPLYSKQSDVSGYAYLVKERAIERRIIKAGAQATAQIVDGEASAIEVISSLERQLMDLRAARSNPALPRLAEHAEAYLEQWLARTEKATLVTFHCGLLDTKVEGPSAGDLIIIGARTSVGKTVLALQCAVHTALSHRLDRAPVVAFFSLEMSREKLFRRALQMAVGFPVNDFALRNMGETEMRAVRAATKDLAALEIYTDETRRLTSPAITAQCHRIKRERGALDLVVIDYFGLLEAVTRRSNEAMELGEISRGLKIAAMELECPFIVPSQLNREADNPAERPRLKHLRGTGSLEQDADLVIFLHRPKTTDQDAMIEDREVIIGKQRDGWVGTLEGKFDKNSLAIFTTDEVRR